MQIRLCSTLCCCVMTGILVFLGGCRTEERKPAPVSTHEQGVKKQTTVVELPQSKGKWRAVVVGITDKRTGKVSDYDIPLGTRTPLPGSDLSITADTFLPHFIMQGSVLTSQSNEPKNPAARITVEEGGNVIFKGWLFAFYPTTHAFQHPRYGFALKGYSPAR